MEGQRPAAALRAGTGKVRGNTIPVVPECRMPAHLGTSPCGQSTGCIYCRACVPPLLPSGPALYPLI